MWIRCELNKWRLRFNSSWALTDRCTKGQTQQSPRWRKIHTGVADIEAFSSVGMIGLKFQSHDVTVRSDLRRNVFSWERSKCGHLWQAFKNKKRTVQNQSVTCIYFCVCRIKPRTGLVKLFFKKKFKEAQDIYYWLTRSLTWWKRLQCDSYGRKMVVIHISVDLNVDLV